MAVDTRDIDLRIVRQADGLEIDLRALQGLWTEAQYLKLTDQTNHLIEFTDGVIEVLPVPTREHQRISAGLYRELFAAVQALGGIVLYAPLRLQIRPGMFREPDLVVLLDEDDPRNQDTFWPGADMVIEIVSPDRPQRDLVDKPVDYAEAGIPEYWIVNPMDETIRVLTLAGDTYTLHGVFRHGDQATSALLPGFALDVTALFTPHRSSRGRGARPTG
jgi:Uma2 family endonuclease